jgi:hypothetical protein
MGCLLQLLTGSPPSDEILEMVWAKAVRPSTKRIASSQHFSQRGLVVPSARVEDEEEPPRVPSPDARITRAAALALVARNIDYVSQQAQIDQIFDEFDADKSGTIAPGELEGFLQKLRPESHVCDADVQYVLDECDKDGDGTLSRDEVLPVCAVWQKLDDDYALRSILEAEEKMLKKSRACAIL